MKGGINQTDKEINNCLRIEIPASIANFGPGFDVFGLALSDISDIFEGYLINSPGISIIHNNLKLPSKSKENIVWVAANHVLEKVKEKYGIDFGIEIRILEKIPIGRGLGSSAASAVGGAVLANELLGSILDESEVLGIALLAESKFSGLHADNIVPAYFGGFFVIESVLPLRYQKINTEFRPIILIIVPEVDVKTSDARKLLPKKIDLTLVSQNVSAATSLVSALYNSDVEKLGESIKDVIVEPYRLKLIPFSLELKKLATDLGALGGSISGSGSSIFFICKFKSQAREIGRKLVNFWKDKCIPSSYYVSTIDYKGVKLIIK